MKQTFGSYLNSSVSLCATVCDVPFECAFWIGRTYKIPVWKWHNVFYSFLSLELYLEPNSVGSGK